MAFFIISDQENLIKAKNWAKELKIELTDSYHRDCTNHIYLEFKAQQLHIIFFIKQQKITTNINFSDYKLTQRRTNHGHKENLIKAFGQILPNDNLYDLTAGFAGDSFLLASYGYNITLIEKHPIIYAITQHAIAELKESKIYHRMKIINIDALQYLDMIETDNNIFYLDPMFENIQKAKVKKNMQLLQHINPDNCDIEILLEKALRKGKKAIVKRNLKAGKIGDYLPHHIIYGSKIKFEIYHS